MKVYLDDERKTPDGWTRVYWPSEAIELLKSGQVPRLAWTTILVMTSVVPDMTSCFGLKSKSLYTGLYRRR